MCYQVQVQDRGSNTDPLGKPPSCRTCFGDNGTVYNAMDPKLMTRCYHQQGYCSFGSACTVVLREIINMKLR